MNELAWTDWLLFPDPRNSDFLVAPFGPGVYQLRLGGELVKTGMARNTAHRVTSLLPAPLGCGTRNNSELREFVLHNIGTLEYRCQACESEDDAKELERRILDCERHLFPH